VLALGTPHSNAVRWRWARHLLALGDEVELLERLLCRAAERHSTYPANDATAPALPLLCPCPCLAPQVLYVNVANLFWNTFLSLMANKSH